MARQRVKQPACPEGRTSCWRIPHSRIRQCRRRGCRPSPTLATPTLLATQAHPGALQTTLSASVMKFCMKEDMLLHPTVSCIRNSISKHVLACVHAIQVQQAQAQAHAWRQVMQRMQCDLRGQPAHLDGAVRLTTWSMHSMLGQHHDIYCGSRMFWGAFTWKMYSSVIEGRWNSCSTMSAEAIYSESFKQNSRQLCMRMSHRWSDLPQR